MIFTDRTIIVQKGTSSINDTIILYRGDKDVEIRFTLNEGSPFKFGIGAEPNIIEKTEAAYGQLIIKTPNDLPSIFSEIVPTNEGKIIFTITAEMIDEITEVGNYTFQIRLLDESMNSRATLPEVVNGIEIREPIATEDVSTTNEVGVATVGYALTTEGVQEDAFDSLGNYNKTTWGTGDRITAAKLNKMEAGIDGVNKKVASGGTGGGNINDTTASATTTYSSNKIETIKESLNSQISAIANLENSTNVVNLEKYNITQADYTTPFTVENYNTAHQNGLGFQQAINEAKERNIQELIIPPGNYPLCYNASKKDEYNAIINSEGIDIIANGCKFYVIYDEEGINPYYSWTDEELTANNGVKDSYLLMGYVFKTNRNITGAEIVGERVYRQNENAKYRDSSYGIILSSKCDNNVIKNCRIHHISGDGIGGGINFNDYETTAYISGDVTCMAQEMINGVSQTSEYCYLSSRLGIGYNVDTSKPLHICNTGYNYFLWTHKPIKVHCFSQANGNTGDYLGTVTVEQGNYFYVPEKTFYVYVQVTYGSTHTSDSTVTYNFRFGNAKYYGTKIEGCDIYLNQRGGISNLPSESIVKKCTIHDNGCAYGNMVAYYDGTQFGIDIEDWYINRLTIEDSLFYGQSNDVLYRCHDLVIKNSTFNNSVSSLNYAVDLHFEHSNFYGNVSLTTPAEFGEKTAIGCKFKKNIASEINIIESNSYELPIATNTTLGGVKPVQKTTSMTQEVGIDSDGLLYTEPISESSSSGNTRNEWQLITNITLSDNTTKDIIISTTDSGDLFEFNEIILRLELYASESSTNFRIEFNDKVVSYGSEILHTGLTCILGRYEKFDEYIIGCITRSGTNFRMIDKSTHIVGNDDNSLLDSSRKISKIKLSTDNDTKFFAANSFIKIYGR